MPCCDTCSCIGESFECLAVVAPDRYPHFKSWCEGTNPSHRMLVRDMSRMGLEEITRINPPTPIRPIAETSPAAGSTPAILAGVPLAGDLVASLTAAIGVDRVMKWVAKKRGKDCNCPSRQAAINKMDAAGRRYLKRLRGGKAG